MDYERFKLIVSDLYLCDTMIYPGMRMREKDFRKLSCTRNAALEILKFVRNDIGTNAEQSIKSYIKSVRKFNRFLVQYRAKNDIFKALFDVSVDLLEALDSMC